MMLSIGYIFEYKLLLFVADVNVADYVRIFRDRPIQPLSHLSNDCFPDSSSVMAIR